MLKYGYGKTEDEARTNASETNKDRITILKENIDTTYYIYAEAEDESGNSLYIIRQINNIDNICPQINSITSSFARIKVNVLDNKSGIKYYTITESAVAPTSYKYELENSNKTLETYIDNLEPNKTYYLWVKDVVGNETSQQFKTKNVDYTITPKLDTWTGSKTVIKFSDLEECVLTYNFGTLATYTYNKETGIEVSKNSMVNYTIQDGNNAITGNIEITNIDATAPSLTATSDYYKITINGSDSQSGIIGYFVTDTEPTNIKDINFTPVNKTKEFEQQITTDYLGNDLVYNQTYYVYLKDAVGNISTKEVISKIDKIKPKIEEKEKKSTTNSVTITVNARDDETGLDGKYRYYISTVQDSFEETPIEIENNSYTFEGLEDGISYYVKVEVTDLAGNLEELNTIIETNELLHVDGDIVFSKASWRNNIQTVKINTTTKNKLRYQIVKPEGTLSLEDSNWSEPIESGSEVTGLEHGDILYVRLYDGTNTSTNEASYNVINAMVENYSTISENDVEKIIKSNFKIHTYDVETDKIKVALSENTATVFTYNYYIKNVKSDTYILKKTTSFFDEQLYVEQQEEGQVYETICIELSSSADGKLSRSSNKTITIAKNKAEAGIYYDYNTTFVDSEHYTAIVPQGFTVSTKETENIISKGLVLSDKKQNEFVWIPVENAIYDEKTVIGSNNNYTPMVRRQKNNLNSFEKIYYTFSGIKSSANITNSAYRLGGNSYIEPALITNSNQEGYTWNILEAKGTDYDADSKNYKNVLGFNYIYDFGEFLNNDYRNMVNSVDLYGGFYCGRYETTSENEIGVKKNSTILNNLNWYNLYLYQNSILYSENPYNNSDVVSSSMISGAQYDAVMNFVLKNESDRELVTKNDETIGNRSNELAKSGAYPDDKMNNIFDLISNCYDFTLESNNITNRVYRGNCYSIFSSDKKVSDRSTLKPSEVGPIIGSRMALYLLDSKDTIPPTFSFETSKTSNTISVKVTASDEGTGVKNYYYSISETGNDGEWKQEYITENKEYTFDGLKSAKDYYIRVRVSDRNDNISEYKKTDLPVTTDAISLKEGDVSISKIYGKDGKGYAYLKIDEECASNGFYPVYQVVKKDTEFNENGTWKDGNIVTELCEGDVIYVVISDGVTTTEKTLDKALALNIVELERYTEKYTQTQEWTDENGDKVWIPAGFKRGDSSLVNTVRNGLVIEDENENEFVWVPVKDVVYDENTSIATNEAEAKKETTFYRPMARKRFKNKKIKLYIAIFLIIAIIIAIITYFSRKDNNIESEIVDNSEGLTLYDTKLSEYVKETEEGIKINTSSELNQDKKLGDLTVTNIQLTSVSGITTLLADVTNNTNQNTDLKNITAVFLDENGKELYSAKGIVRALDIGETARINISISSNYVTAYDIEFKE